MPPGTPPGDAPGAPVRVLINALHAKTGGGLTYLNNLVPLLARDAALELHLLIHEDQRASLAPAVAAAPTVAVGFGGGFAWRLIWEQLRVPAMARRLGARVTFSPANFAPLLAPGSVILLRNALAVSAHDRRLGKRLYWAVLGLMTRLSLIAANRAIAVSAYALDALGAGPKPGRPAKLSVVHHGVGAPFAPSPVPVARQEFLLSVGDLYVQKNLMRLVEAFARLRPDYPNLSLRIAGRAVDAAYEAQLRQMIEQLGLADALTLLGHVDSQTLAGLYRSCRLFVFPSTVETFGNPLLEAMACGAAVVCSNTTAMPEVTGGAAQMFDPEDVDDMVRAIRAVLADEALCRRLEQASLDRAQAFTWERCAQETARVLIAAGGGFPVSRSCD